MNQCINYLQTSRKAMIQLGGVLYNIIFEFAIPMKLVGLIKICMNGTYSRRKLYSEELTNLCSSPNSIRGIKSRRMGWVEFVARMRERRGIHKVLVGNPLGRSALGRPRRRWEWLGI
jgi:hypothetical protein